MAVVIPAVGQDDPGGWAYRHEDEVLNLVLPGRSVTSPRLDPFPLELNWRVTVRGSDGSLWRLVVQSGSKGREATLTEVVGDPREEIAAAKAKQRDLTVEEATSAVTIRHHRVTDVCCPELGGLTREFESLRQPLAPEGRVVVHGNLYEVWFEAPMLVQGYLVIVTTPELGDDTASWIRKARHVLDTCSVGCTTAVSPSNDSAT